MVENNGKPEEIEAMNLSDETEDSESYSQVHLMPEPAINKFRDTFSAIDTVLIFTLGEVSVMF